MQVQTGFRFRCYPTSAQAQVLLRWMGCQRFIDNAKVTEDRYYRKFARKALGLPEQYLPVDPQYSRSIHPDLTPWRKEVPSPVLRHGAVRWRQACARYFQGLGGRPVIRKKIGRQAVWFTSELFAFKPNQTSQECAECGYIQPDNRVSQSEFVCQACGHQDNADHNAGRAIARRGVRLLPSGGYAPKEVKRCGIFRQKANEEIAPVRSESTPGESIASRVAGNGRTQGTEHPLSEGRNQETLFVREETPATTVQTV
jgi:hypothetical protein